MDEALKTRDSAFEGEQARSLGTALAGDAFGSPLMATGDNDDDRLRSAAPRNATSDQAVGGRAEDDLVASRRALERRTEELAQSNRRLSLMAWIGNSLTL